MHKNRNLRQFTKSWYKSIVYNEKLGGRVVIFVIVSLKTAETNKITGQICLFQSFQVFNDEGDRYSIIY